MSAVAPAPVALGTPSQPQQQQQQPQQQRQQQHQQRSQPQTHQQPLQSQVPHQTTIPIPPTLIPNTRSTGLTSNPTSKPSAVASIPFLSSFSLAAASPRFAYADRFSQDLLNLYGAYYATIGRDGGLLTRNAPGKVDAPGVTSQKAKDNPPNAVEVGKSPMKDSSDESRASVATTGLMQSPHLQNQNTALPAQKLKQNQQPQLQLQQQLLRPSQGGVMASRPPQAAAVVTSAAPQQQQSHITRQLQPGAVIARPPPQQQPPLSRPAQPVAILARPTLQQQQRPVQQHMPRTLQPGAMPVKTAQQHLVPQQQLSRPLQTAAAMVNPVLQNQINHQQRKLQPSAATVPTATPGLQQQPQLHQKQQSLRRPTQPATTMANVAASKQQQTQMTSRTLLPGNEVIRAVPPEQSVARPLQTEAGIARPTLHRPSQKQAVAGTPTQQQLQRSVLLPTQPTQATLASKVSVPLYGQPRPPPLPGSSASAAQCATSLHLPTRPTIVAPAGTLTVTRPAAQTSPPPPAPPPPPQSHAKSRPAAQGSQGSMTPCRTLVAPPPTPVPSLPAGDSTLRAALAHLERMYGPAAVAGLYDMADSAVAPAAAPLRRLIPYARRPTRSATNIKNSGRSVAAISAWLQRSSAAAPSPAIPAPTPIETGARKAGRTAAPTITAPVLVTQANVKSQPMAALPPPQMHNPACIPRRHKHKAHVRPLVAGPPVTPSPRSHPYPRQRSISLQHQHFSPPITGPLYEGDVYNLLFSPHCNQHTHQYDYKHHGASRQSSIVTVAPLVKRARRTPFAREAFTAVIGKWMRGVSEKDEDQGGNPGLPPAHEPPAATMSSKITTGPRSKAAVRNGRGEAEPPAKKRRREMATAGLMDHGECGGADASPHFATPRVNPSGDNDDRSSHDGGKVHHDTQHDCEAATASTAVAFIPPRAADCQAEFDAIRILAESLRDRVHDHDLAALEAEEQQIRAETHPSLIPSLADLQTAYDDRVRAAAARLHHETRRLAADCDAAAALAEGTYRDRLGTARRRMSDALLSHAWELEADEAREARETYTPPQLTAAENHAARVAATPAAANDPRVAPWLRTKLLTAGRNIIVPRFPVGLDAHQSKADVHEIRAGIALAAAADAGQRTSLNI
ncbi:hypothetical protein HDU86_004623 [Geranomyces michiganensis]|nr:hypothetical protein HDU86_004623 [Geranomyces michiganensis]